MNRAHSLPRRIRRSPRFERLEARSVPTTIVDLGNLGGGNTFPTAINSLGQVAGYSDTATHATHAFLYTNGTITDLGTFGGIGSGSYAYGINDSGEVVGESGTPNQVYNAFTYSNGVMTNIGTLGNQFINSGALGINSAGDVVGYSDNAVSTTGQTAFLYHDGKMTPLGTLGGKISSASAISASGVIVGGAAIQGGSLHAFVYQDGKMTDLSSLGFSTSAKSINSAGDIVGNAQGYSLTKPNVAFLYSNGEPKLLDVNGSANTSADCINDNGVVVGYATGANNTIYAYEYSNGVFTNLNTLLPSGSNWVLYHATAINNNGQIVGLGKHNGKVTAFLLDPSGQSTTLTVKLDAASDTGLKNDDGITRRNGSASLPLVFDVTETPDHNDFYRLYDVTDPNNPVLLAGPVQAPVRTVTVANHALAVGTQKIAVTAASSATSAEGDMSAPTTISIQSSLKVVSITPTDGTYKALSGGKVTVTFNYPIAGLNPDVASGAIGSDPLAVTLAPRGPGGTFAAPFGLDSGSTPIPATLVYHVNANGKATITLTPRAPLGTDRYRITVDGALNDLAGNALTDAQGSAGSQTSDFTLKATASNATALKILSVTTLRGTVAIANKPIPQPDTIAIKFNKPVDFLTITPDTVRLLAGPSKTPMAAAVAYSPTTTTVYLTPEAVLDPRKTYTVRVAASVTDDQSFPKPDKAYSLGKDFTTTFTVKSAGVGPGKAPLVVLSQSGHLLTTPGFCVRKALFGYASIPFSETVDMKSLGRFSVELLVRSGGTSTTAFDLSDPALNVRLAFNPNLNMLIVVPTVPLANDTYKYVISDVKGAKGDSLVNPGGTLPVSDTFTLSVPPPTHTAAATVATAPERTPSMRLAGPGRARHTAIFPNVISSVRYFPRLRSVRPHAVS